MISTTIPLTLSLSVAFGLYMLAGALAVYRLGDRLPAMLNEFERSPALTYVAGILTFALGTAVVLAHNIWSDPLAVVVTLIGWVAAIEGLLLIAWPDPLWRFARLVEAPSWRPVFAAVTLALGLALLLAGLTGTAG